jgi:alpha-1,6-mannosyltransferase
MAAASRARRLAVALGLMLVGAAVVAVAVAGDLKTRPMLALLLLAAALAGALLVVQAARALAPPLLLGGILALRALALLAPYGGAGLSDDQHRYIHEGRAQRLGLAVPYAVPPAAVLPPPDDGSTARVNHPEVPAAYPPGVELVLLLTVAAGDVLGAPLLPLRLLLLGADVLVVCLLYRRRARAPRAYALYGVHPLPLLEIAIGGHLDGLGVAAVLLALLSSRPALQGALIGLGAHVKPIAIVAIVGVKRAALPMALAGLVAAVMLPAVPHLVAGAPLQRGLIEFSTRWRAAPFVYAVLEAPLVPVFEARAAASRYAHLHLRRDGLLLEDGGRPLLSAGRAGIAARPILLDAGFFARLLAGALLAVVLLVIARARATPERRVGMALLAVWLLAPTVHPWYLTWIVPFAALSSSRALWGFSATSPLLYQPVFGLAQGREWDEAAWPRLLMLAALVIGALVDARAAGGPLGSPGAR